MFGQANHSLLATVFFVSPLPLPLCYVFQPTRRLSEAAALLARLGEVPGEQPRQTPNEQILGHAVAGLAHFSSFRAVCVVTGHLMLLFSGGGAHSDCCAGAATAPLPAASELSVSHSDLDRHKMCHQRHLKMEFMC